MIRHRLPVNVYQYRATISGMPIKDLLMLLIILCFSLLLSRFSLLLLLAFATISLLIYIFLARARGNASILARLFSLKKEGMEDLEATFHEINGHLLISSGIQLSMILRVSNLDLLSMRQEHQEDILASITDALNHVGNQVEFLSMHIHDNGDSRSFGQVSFQSFLRLTTKLDGSNFGNASEKLLASAVELSRYFSNAGFELLEMDSREELSQTLMNAAGSSGTFEQTGTVHRKSSLKGQTAFKQFVNFAKTDHYISDIVVRNTSYSSGPFYLTLLESMKIPLDIILTLRDAGSGNQLQYISRLLAERRTEYRFSRGISRETEYLKQQVADLERIKDSVEKEGNRVFDITLTIRVHAEHPAILNARVQRIESSMGMLGFRTVRDTSSSLKKIKSFSLNLTRPKYLMDALSIASILPIYRNENSGGEGIIIGIDDLSEKIVHYNPYSQDSYNSLIIGETGSGKSHFTKMFLMRSIAAGVSQKAIIFDPLNEYSCKLFGTDCMEYSIRSYVKRDLDQFIEEGNRPEKPQDVLIKIIKPEYEELENDMDIEELLLAMNREMTMNHDKRALIVIDECHIILRSSRNAKSLGTMVRHSRHYNTSIMNISQNTDDFINRQTSNIAFNSNRIFIFRTRNMNDSHKKVLKIDGFDIPPPENLAGGNRHQYSECIVSDGTYCRTLRIITSGEEDKLLKNSA